MVSYVGVDVSSEVLDVCAGPSYASRQFFNSRAGIHAMTGWLVRSLSKQSLHLVIEPTSTYHQLLVHALIDQGIRYTLINPARTAMFARMQGKRAKTDRVDARLLAEMGQREHLRPTQAPTPVQQELKTLRRHREWLEGEARAVSNRLEAARRSPSTPQIVLDSLDRTRKELLEEAKAIDKAAKRYLDANEDLKASADLLISIPGVGQRTAIMLLSEMPLVQRCDNAKAWVAFCGLNPETRESGKKSWSRLSRMGAARIRAALYLAAVSALRWNPLVRALGDRLSARGKAGKVRVVAAMSKLLRICFGVLKNSRPFDPEVHQHSLS